MLNNVFTLFFGGGTSSASGSEAGAAPVITSNGGGATAAITVNENTTAVTTVTATDVDSPTLTYSISGGADAGQFAIGSSSGVLTFVSAPNFEVPTDANLDNAYVVIVQVSDGALTDTQTITVTVADVGETGPTISTVAFTSTPTGAAYGVGEVMQVTITWSEGAIVTGTPRLTVNVGGSNKNFDYASGTGTTALVFSYTVQAGDTDTNGASIAANSLALNSGTIKNAAANNATLTHSAVTDQAAHKVDTTAPTVSSFSPVDGATGVAVNTNLVVVFSEAVAFHTVVSITLRKTSDDSIFQTFTQTDISGALTISSATLTINPTSDLAGSTGYYVLIGATSIKDLSGNFYAGIAVKTTWDFTTGVSAFTPSLDFSDPRNSQYIPGVL